MRDVGTSSAKRGHQPPTKADETPEFKEVWEVVWRNVKSDYDGRALAREAYFRHVWWRGADEKDILDAAKAYVRTAKREGPKLLFGNWLDRGSYEDLAEQERAYQGRLKASPAAAQGLVEVVTPPKPMSPEEQARRAQLAAKARMLVRGALQ